MFCKGCGYRLWNLAARRSPECGRPFVPSEFEFVPSSVQFCCPHCGQPYYGTDPQGLLVPRSFDCVKCHTRVHLDEMLVLPAPNVDEQQTVPQRMPWLDRRTRGRVHAWFSTVGMALVSPLRLMRALPPNAPAGPAWLFALTATIPVALLGCGTLGILMFGMAPFRAGPPRLLAVLAGFAMGWGLLAAVFLVAGLVTHGLLRLTGATAHGLGRTYQALCYSTGANIVSAIPCVGYYVGWIWWVVSAVLMVKEAQRVHGLRATIAVLTTPVLAVAGFIGLAAWTTYVVTTRVTSGMGSGGTVTAQLVAQALLSRAAANQGQFPPHAAALLTDNTLNVTYFTVYPGTDAGKVPIGGTTLDRYWLLSPAQAAPYTAAAVAALPPGTVAYRVGDLVFTYSGFGWPPPDPNLCLVLQSPDPNQGTGQLAWVVAGLADGRVVTVMPAELPLWLTRQNALRARFKLPPLPAPATVTHARPAVVTPRGTGPK